VAINIQRRNGGSGRRARCAGHDLQALNSGFGIAELSVLAEPDLKDGDARVRWIEALHAKIMAQVEPDNIVLTMLRRIDEKIDRVIEDVRDLKTRVTNLEEGLAKVDRIGWPNHADLAGALEHPKRRWWQRLFSR
jgi:hypothetical protein